MSVLQDSYEIISYMLINKKTFNKSLNAFFTTNVRNDESDTDMEFTGSGWTA